VVFHGWFSVKQVVGIRGREQESKKGREQEREGGGKGRAERTEVVALLFWRVAGILAL
jgi:hypothetical protein